MFAASAPASDDATSLALQGSLFAHADPSFDASFGAVERTWLDDDCWVDHGARWLAGADLVFGELVARLAWAQRVVPMYGRMVDEPRLTWWWRAGSALPWPLLGEMADGLGGHYGVALDSISANLYRTGRDSVAYHSDSVRPTAAEPLVAIVSVGAPRPFLVRPKGGGRSRAWLLGQGDLLVMGGAMQHRFEHAVPKVAQAGPRLSVMFRHASDLPPGPEARYRPLDGPRLRRLPVGSEHHPSRHRASTGPAWQGDGP